MKYNENYFFEERKRATGKKKRSDFQKKLSFKIINYATHYNYNKKRFV